VLLRFAGLGERPSFTGTIGLPQSLCAAWTIIAESSVAIVTALTSWPWVKLPGSQETLVSPQTPDP
jgi:hypothetical protein